MAHRARPRVTPTPPEALGVGVSGRQRTLQRSGRSGVTVTLRTRRSFGNAERIALVAGSVHGRPSRMNTQSANRCITVTTSATTKMPKNPLTFTDQPTSRVSPWLLPAATHSDELGTVAVVQSRRSALRAIGRDRPDTGQFRVVDVVVELVERLLQFGC
jgi:hypothetical protein